MLRFALTVSFLTFISRILGYVRDVLIAAYLGAGILTEAYVAAFRLPNLFRTLFAEGAFSAAFVPQFALIETQGSTIHSRNFINNAFSLMLLLLLAFVAVMELGMDWVVYALAPGFADTPERFDLVTDFARITMPYLLFISLVSLLSGILQTKKRFAAPAAAPIYLNLTMICGLLYLTKFTATPAHALIISIPIAGVIQFFSLYLACKRLGYMPALVWPSLSADIRMLFSKMIPGIIGSASTQINLFINTIIASFVPGAMAFLYFADRVVQLPLSLIGTALGTILLPILTQKIQHNEPADSIHFHNRVIEIALLFAVPAATALAFMAEPIVTVLFERGAFTSNHSSQTSGAMMALAWGLPAFILLKLATTPFFARRDTSTPVYIAIACICLNVVINLLLIKDFQHVGIAYATTITAWVNLSALAYCLFKRKWWYADRLLKLRASKIMLATLGMITVLQISLGFAAFAELQWLNKFLSLAAVVSAGMLTYFVLLVILRTIPRQEIKAMWRKD